MTYKLLGLFKTSFIVGDPERPYLLRWHLIPRNRFFNVYLHKFLRSDDDRALHDHPWAFNASILLKGSYIEHTKNGDFLRRRGRIYIRRGEYAHRVQLIKGKPVWTLFITGRKVRAWGFHCPQGWRHWKDFVKITEVGNDTGVGCDD